MGRIKCPWGDLGRTPGNGVAEMWGKVYVYAGVGWLEEITHRERGSVRNSGAGLLGHGHSLFSLNVFTLLQWQLHFKQLLKLYLGFGGKPKRRGWVPSLDHAEQKENKSRGGEPRWARAKPSCANQEPEVIRKAKTSENAAIMGRESHFLQDSRRGLESILFKSQRAKWLQLTSELK